MRILFLIGAGSFIGGIFRYLLSQCVHAKFFAKFPLGTLIVNIIGCFCIGLFFGLANKINFSNEWKLFLVTGLLGGFTTFSAFSNDTVLLFKDGQVLYAAIYIFSSIFLGLAATFIGNAIIKNI